MERKIGEIFEFEGTKLQVVKGFDCGTGNDSCYFEKKEKCFNYWGITGECQSSGRKDNKCVIFKEIK